MIYGSYITIRTGIYFNQLNQLIKSTVAPHGRFLGLFFPGISAPALSTWKILRAKTQPKRGGHRTAIHWTVLRGNHLGRECVLVANSSCLQVHNICIFVYLYLSIYILTYSFIYIFICVCVCVCVLFQCMTLSFLNFRDEASDHL